MEITQIRKSDVKLSLWDGGKTWESFIYPFDKEYKNQDFDFRISTASIEKSPSEFTRFEGYKRFLVMLDNNLKIFRNNVEENYEKLEVFLFDSTDEIESQSEGNDFNLMICKERMTAKVDYNSVSNNYNNSFIFVFGVDKAQLSVNEEIFELNKYECLLIKNLKREHIKIQSGEKVIFGRIDYV